MTPDAESGEAPEHAFASLLEARRSCRAFLPSAVPPALIDRMLGLAQQAPSWCNTQPWRVDVTSGAATARLRAALSAYASSGRPSAPDLSMPTSYDGVYLERRRASGWQLYEAVGVRRGDRAASGKESARNLEFFGAPHVAIVTTASTAGEYGSVDGGIYLAHLLLAAEAVGLAAVAQAAVARYAPVIHEHLGIGDDRRLLVAVAFGYADELHPANSFRTGRASTGDADVVRYHS